jgi:predicted adenylyl cyclase CyaB
MNRITQIEKTRKEYISDIYTVAIDNVKDLGRFIEIESLISDELQKPVTLDNIMQLASEL